MTCFRYWPKNKPIPQGWVKTGRMEESHHGEWSVIIMEQKYKAGDVVHVRLDWGMAIQLNEDECYPKLLPCDIIAHIPTTEPVVRWVNVYGNGAISGYAHETKRSADLSGIGYIFRRTCTLRLEWPDGDTSKKPVVSVEDV